MKSILSFDSRLSLLLCLWISSSLARENQCKCLHSDGSVVNSSGISDRLLEPQAQAVDYPELAPRKSPSKRSGDCQPFATNFSPGDVSSTSYSAPFIAVSPPGSYKVTQDGLQMFLRKPQGKVTRHGNTNDVQGEGATINSTSVFQ